MRRDRNPGLTLFALLVYVFLFAPIVILIIFSFNDAKDVFAWEGFTLSWYPELLRDRNLMHGLSVSLQVAAIAVVTTVVLTVAIDCHPEPRTIAAARLTRGAQERGPIAVASHRRSRSCAPRCERGRSN